VARRAHVYRFKLSDREFAAAWLREYYRRPGLRIVRVLAGPGLIGLGAVMRASPETFTRFMGLASIALGVWLVLKPFLMAWAFTSQRRRRNRGNVEMEVRLDASGMHVSDGSQTTAIAWEKIAMAGVADRYVWLELKSGSRATIPRRAIDDLDALRELLSANVRLS
jgi:hypothetical protein